MKSSFFLKDKSFYKAFATLTVIISLNSLISFAVNLADNVMIGRYSEIALSGVALGNQVHFLAMMIIGSVGNGVVVLGAQFWGARDTDKIKGVISVGMKFAMVIGLLFTLVTMFFPRWTLSLLTSDETVIEAGMEYLKVMCWSYIIFSISNTVVTSLRSVEITVVGTVMSVATLLINVGLNYCLIFGNLGFPELGITGAAIATLASRIVEMIVVLFYALVIDKKLRLKVKDIFGFNKAFLKPYIKVATPVILSGATWGFAQTAQMSILGHMSQNAIAASSISGVVFQLASTITLSSANAASVLTGKLIGARRFDDVKPACRSMQAMFVCIGIIASAVLFFTKDFFISFYTVTEETRELTYTFMNILTIAVFGMSYEYPTSKGIVQGGGDTKYGFIVDTIAMWCFAIPFSALSAFVFNWPPVVTFSILKADQILKCIPNGIKCNRYRWIRRLNESEEGAVNV